MKKLLPIIIIGLLVLGGFMARSYNAAEARDQALRLATMSGGEETTQQLDDLRRYVLTHTGATTDVVLTAAYEENLSKSKAAAAVTTNTNTDVYARAQAACGGKADSVTQAKCNQEFLEKNLVPATAPAVMMPELADYTYRFASPALTFDLASLLFALALIGFVGLIAFPIFRR